jgi:8-oxo-dGTP pyrophosphatase MutT (NUDIX family)
MIEKEKYIKILKKTKLNPASPIELVTDIKEIEDYEAQTNDHQMIGVIDNSPFYKFRMDLYRIKNTNEKFRYCNVEYDKIGAVSLVIFHILKGKSKGDYLLLQRSFRVFIDQFIYECPRGFANFNESSIETMARELFEETSIDLKTLRHKTSKLGKIYPDTGLTNNLVDLYQVDIFIDAELILKNNDPKEFIDKYQLIPVSEIKSFIPKIMDGFTLCALAKTLI